MTKDETRPGVTLRVSLVGAEVGAEAAPGDTVRVAYREIGSRPVATRVMNVTRQDEVGRRGRHGHSLRKDEAHPDDPRGALSHVDHYDFPRFDEWRSGAGGVPRRRLGSPCVGREIVVEAAAKVGVPEKILAERLERGPGVWDRLTLPRRMYVATVQGRWPSTRSGATWSITATRGTSCSGACRGCCGCG